MLAGIRVASFRLWVLRWTRLLALLAIFPSKKVQMMNSQSNQPLRFVQSLLVIL